MFVIVRTRERYIHDISGVKTTVWQGEKNLRAVLPGLYRTAGQNASTDKMRGVFREPLLDSAHPKMVNFARNQDAIYGWTLAIHSFHKTTFHYHG